MENKRDLRLFTYCSFLALWSRTRELNEHKIRPHIIVDRLTLDPEETKRRAFLRAGGDRLQTDDTLLRCENTVQGVHILTDSMGTS
jgi:hypothetical protein